MRKLIVGCGYLGRAVARTWRAEGHAVVAITRSAERAESLARDGLQPIVADVTRPDTLAGLPPAQTVLYSVGFDKRGAASRREVYVEGLATALDALSNDTERILFTSSTGVYGRADGAWVDEQTPCHPTREGGRLMGAAEQVLREHRLSDRAVVLRLAGLYGPGRIPRLADLLAGRPIAVPSIGYVNLIHVDDAAAAVVAADRRGRPGRTYLVSDGNPVPRREFYTDLATALGLPAPSFVEPPPEAVSEGRAAASKRVANARMRRELGVDLRYPSYREGLRAIAAGGVTI
jgi:nucleoside-diphosphate-sugar epimerase